MYCIYSNKNIDKNKANPEHIIPLSLGGCNDFVIYVDKEINSKLGSFIDGKLGNDYLINSLIRRKGFKGHSKKKASFSFTKVQIKDSKEPLQIVYKEGSKNSTLFSPIKKRELTKEESSGLKLNIQMKFDKDIRMLFVAKTLLSAGYFVYGKTFVDHADHQSLRILMNYKRTEAKDTVEKLPLRVLDEFHEVPKEQIPYISTIKTICTSLDCSCVIFWHQNNRIVGSVGIAGHYIGIISFDAKVDEFPNEGHFKFGHVVGVKNGKLKHSSFQSIASMIYDKHFG